MTHLYIQFHANTVTYTCTYSFILTCINTPTHTHMPRNWFACTHINHIQSINMQFLLHRNTQCHIDMLRNLLKIHKHSEIKSHNYLHMNVHSSQCHVMHTYTKTHMHTHMYALVHFKLHVHVCTGHRCNCVYCTCTPTHIIHVWYTKRVMPKISNSRGMRDEGWTLYGSSERPEYST